MSSNISFPKICSFNILRLAARPGIFPAQDLKSLALYLPTAKSILTHKICQINIIKNNLNYIVPKEHLNNIYTTKNPKLS